MEQIKYSVISLKAFRVLNPGIQTTVQDLGRPGLMKYGIPHSGAMDRRSFIIGNLLVGNQEGAASLEIVLHGLKLQALTKMTIAVTGADLAPQVNHQAVPQWAAISVENGDIVNFKKRKNGFRAYLAVRGGFDVPKVLGSHSTFIRGRIGKALGKGDVLNVGSSFANSLPRFTPLSHNYLPIFNTSDPILVLNGPQRGYFTPRGIATFFQSTYRITSQSDRQALRTEGPAIEIAKGPDIITDPIPPGAIQVPGDGKPIVLLRDAQVTGGYAKIAAVAMIEMDRLGQMMPGDLVRFQNIDRQAALDLLGEENSRIAELKALFK